MRQIVFFTQEEGGWMQAALIKGSQKEIIKKLKQGLIKKERADKIIPYEKSIIVVDLLWHDRSDYDRKEINDYNLYVAAMVFPNGRVFDCRLGMYRDEKLKGYPLDAYRNLLVGFDVHPNGGTMTQRATFGTKFWRGWRIK